MIASYNFILGSFICLKKKPNIFITSFIMTIERWFFLYLESIQQVIICSFNKSYTNNTGKEGTIASKKPSAKLQLTNFRQLQLMISLSTVQ